MDPDYSDKLFFASDYMEGAHPRILERLSETNMISQAGYGDDTYSNHARELIREACEVPDADIYFLVGGTQTNAVVIDSLTQSYQGVVASEAGHISTHEAGAIEFTGHKVMTLPEKDGKISASEIKDLVEGYRNDENHEHMVMPGMVYISHPTESGTFYSLKELTEISEVCHEYGLPLYMDGARMAYGLACPESDVTLPDIARLCDVFYIGGTKCGALLGEAVVIPKHDLIPHFFTLIKQHGALLAKGRAAGVQFETLFTDGLYMELGRNAIDAAARIRQALKDKGYEFAIDSPTNQIFLVLTPKEKARLEENIVMGFWENLPDGRIVMRIATSWATTEENVDRLIALL